MMTFEVDYVDRNETNRVKRVDVDIEDKSKIEGEVKKLDRKFLKMLKYKKVSP